MIRSAIRAALAAVLSPATGRGQQYVGQTLDLGFDNDTYRILADGTLVSKKFSDIVTFSRASNATRFSPTGQLQYAPHNLLLQSQTFDNASWSKSSVTVTANAGVAPDGTTTADKVIPTAVSSQFKQLQQNITVVAGTTYTFSGFYKADGYNFVQLIGTSASFGTFSVNFDLSNGTETDFAAGTSTVVARFIENYGKGWYRIGVSVICLGSSSSARLIDNIIPASNSVRGVTWTGDGTSGVLTWGLQIAVGPNALDYTPTTTAVVYGPRFDYDPTTLAAKGLLIEEQRTNSVLYSEQFDNAAWAKSGSTVTANTIIAPDGTVAGDSLVEDSGSSGHRIAQTYVGNSTVLYTASFYAKLSGRSWARVLIDDNSGNSADAYFNLAAGVIGTTAASGTATAVSSQIQAVGNGWYRCTVTCVPSAINSGNVRAYISGTTGNGTSSYTGTNGLTSIFIWGAQLEAGAFATSYIPTTTAATTRSADIASIDTLSPWYNSVEMTVYTEYDIIGKTTTSGFATEIDDGTLNNRIINIGQEIGVGDVKLGSFMNSGGSTSVNDYPITAMNVGSVYKLAFAVKSNDAATVANGISVLDATAVIPSGLTTLRLGRRITDRYLNGHLRRITYTPRRLTDAELQSLTS